MTSVAIIGGGPGGLMTAYLLERNCKQACQTTLFEASDRIGGKILTRRFDSAPVIYEAGVAEVYDYGEIGPDPLRQLIGELGLKTRPVEGQTVILNGKLLRNETEISLHCGAPALRAIREFRQRAAAMMPIKTWCEASWQDDNHHPWARRTCEDVLNEVTDPAARKFLQVAAHSDLATEPHLTTGLNGLKNFVMDVPGYVRQRSIVGGMEMLPQALREHLTHTRLEVNAPIVRVEKNGDERYRVRFRQGRSVAERDFDAVFIALPHNWLNSIEWGGERLRRAMAAHIAYYDRPAHYLRISILFQKPFWQRLIAGSWFMLDAFGGCCVYDESARHDAQGYGVLGWLVAGSDALTLNNLDERLLIERAIESLPAELSEEAREHFIEGKVHRWMAAVSAQPGGQPARAPRLAHWPEPAQHPGIFIVGDYLFDSTLNGVFDSANFATGLMRSRMPSRRAQNANASARAGRRMTTSSSHR